MLMVDNIPTSVEHHTDADIGYYTNCSVLGTVPCYSFPEKFVPLLPLGRWDKTFLES